MDETEADCESAYFGSIYSNEVRLLMGGVDLLVLDG